MLRLNLAGLPMVLSDVVASGMGVGWEWSSRGRGYVST